MSQQNQTSQLAPYLPGQIFSGLGQIGVGKEVVDRFGPMARGKDLYYHGSDPANYPAMRREGIKTTGEMADRGRTSISHILAPDAFEQSRPLAFMSKVRGSAMGYQTQAQFPEFRDIPTQPKNPGTLAAYRKSLGRPEEQTGDALDHDWYAQYMKDRDAHEALQEPYNKWQAQAGELQMKRITKVFPKLFKDTLNPFAPRPLRIEMPHGGVGGPQIVPNPEVAALRESEGWDLLGQRAQAIKLLEKEPGVVGGIASKFIRGGEGYKWLDRAAMAESPGRALLGLLGVGGGLALAGHGGQTINHSLVQPFLQNHKSAGFIPPLMKAPPMGPPSWDKHAYIRVVINTEANLRLEAFPKQATNIFQPVDLKPAPSIAANMKLQGLEQGLAGLGIGALGGGVAGMMAPTERHRRRNALIGALLGGLGGAGAGAYQGADQAYRSGMSENADILNQTADNETFAGVPLDPSGVSQMRREAREMQESTLLKTLLQ